MERPYGGATSIKEAQDYLAAAEDRAKVWTQWDFFSSVAQNILSDDTIEDKRPAMAAAIRDFEKLLGTKARSKEWQTLRQKAERRCNMGPAKSIREVADRLLGGGVQIKSHDPRRGRQTFRSVFNDLLIDAEIRRSLRGVALSMALKSLRSRKK